METTFKIDIADSELDELRRRLQATRWPDEIQNSDWDYGTNRAYLKELCQYWATDFDWRKQEAALNAFPHFKTRIDGFEIHYIYQKGKGSRSIPILLIHGWPDSFVRFLKLIPLLTQADADGFSFDVIVPSIPGYGFSEKSVERGMTAGKIAGIFHALMTDHLSFKTFAAHGGDWGSAITHALTKQFPKSLSGVHFTDIPYMNILSIPPDELSEEEKKYLEAGKKWQMTEGAYAMLHATKPQTLAYGLNDSPAGLAAWIVEKFRSWSDCGGNVEASFTKDELLTNISIYWFTGTINSAIRIYYERMHAAPESKIQKSGVPTAVAIFPKDTVPSPRAYSERLFDVRQFTNMKRGGHFGAMEEPVALAGDMRKFFSSLLNK